MNDNSELVPIRAVAAGIVTLVGGKVGELWALEEKARACQTGDELREVATPFAADKGRKPTVGAVYETNGRVEDGRIVSIGKSRQYVEMLDTPALQAAAFASRGIEQREVAKRAEAKARASLPGNEAIEQLAAIVAAGPINHQELIISAISSAIRKEALAIWKRSK